VSARAKVWLSAVVGCLCVFILAALTLRNSFLLTVLTDIIEGLLLGSGVAAFLPLALRSKGRLRLFWSLMTLGVFLWFFYQTLWIWFEVVLQRDVPDLFMGDVILFLNIVPMMAALALRPHVPRDEYERRLGRLDFALLLVWWFYLYVFTVIPWQYVEADLESYNRNLNTVYLLEKLAFLIGLAACWLGSKGAWRKLYIGLFGMSLSYSASSALANWAIARNEYYSGSFYDIPMACAMAWLTWIGLRTKVEEPSPKAAQESPLFGVWVARFSMIAVFSLPLFAIWAMADAWVPPRVRIFRLMATLVAAFVLGLMLFFRQFWLDRELVHLLHHSRDSFDNLTRLQAQILQSEKLASLGQLVGGAAHELNNPITAMLGYSDLLSGTALTPQQQPVAARIGQDVRRTKSLVASLISFARQTPAAKAPVDLNTLARTAVKLAQPHWESRNLTVETNFDPELPKILGDSNQLLQVCLQLIGNCFHATDQHGHSLSLRTMREGVVVVLELSITAPPNTNLQDQSAELVPEVSHGLSACQGILQEHGGQVLRAQSNDGALVLRVELPAMAMPPDKATGTTAAVLRQSQPFA
jgi:signal transduction histidine kinase